MTSLTNLVLGPSQMKEFPEIVCAIPALTSLEYGGNPPSSPSSLSSLLPTSFLLFPLPFSVPTPHSFRFSYLLYVLLGMKGLTALPASVSALTNLQRLIVRFNEFSDFPAVVLSLPRLTFLDLAGNGLTEVPPQIAQLALLQHLNLTFNKLQVPLSPLPSFLSPLPSLSSLPIPLSLFSLLIDIPFALADKREF